MRPRHTCLGKRRSRMKRSLCCRAFNEAEAHVPRKTRRAQSVFFARSRAFNEAEAHVPRKTELDADAHQNAVRPSMRPRHTRLGKPIRQSSEAVAVIDLQ